MLAASSNETAGGVIGVPERGEILFVAFTVKFWPLIFISRFVVV